MDVKVSKVGEILMCKSCCIPHPPREFLQSCLWLLQRCVGFLADVSVVFGREFDSANIEFAKSTDVDSSGPRAKERKVGEKVLVLVESSPWVV